MYIYIYTHVTFIFPSSILNPKTQPFLQTFPFAESKSPVLHSPARPPQGNGKKLHLVGIFCRVKPSLISALWQRNDSRDFPAHLPTPAIILFIFFHRAIQGAKSMSRAISKKTQPLQGE